MTSQEIVQLLALCEAATPGPWIQEKQRVFDDVDGPCAIGPERPDRLGEVSGGGVSSCDGCPITKHPGDAAFIAAARTALPAALDEVERLRGVYKSAVEGRSDMRKALVRERKLTRLGITEWETVEAVERVISERDKLRAENESLKEQMTKLVLATDCARRTDGDEVRRLLEEAHEVIGQYAPGFTVLIAELESALGIAREP